MAAGNRSVLVIIDSRRVAERCRADLTVFAALDHFGVLYEVLECADSWALPPDYLSERALYLVAHDGAGSGISPTVAAGLAAGIRNGTGLVSLDREVDRWETILGDFSPRIHGRSRSTVLTIGTRPHFITEGHACGETVPLLGELETLTFETIGTGWDPLLHDDQENPVVACTMSPGGRLVFLGTGDALYDETVLGHTRGMDGLMWRSIVWAAKKPFVMRCMPPFVSARFDDCNGTYSAFGYVSILNANGIRPNIGLFTDEMGPLDWQAAKVLSDSGGADFSMHAFRDDFYKQRENWRPFAVRPDKPDLSKGGTEVAFEGLSLDHYTGKDLPDARIRLNISRMDEQFGRAGVRYSRVLNAHFGEVANAVIPYLLERRITFPCNNSVVGQLYGHQPVWRPGPYALRGTNGRYGVVIARTREHPAMVNVGFSASHLGSTHMETDILHRNVPFIGEAAEVRIGDAVSRGIRNLKLGLDAMACGKLFTHEERVDVISLDDWNTIVREILAGLGELEWEGTSREWVSETAAALLDTRLAWSEMSGEELTCLITGRAECPSPLTIWTDEADRCIRTVHTVEPFDGCRRMKLRLAEGRVLPTDS